MNYDNILPRAFSAEENNKYFLLAKNGDEDAKKKMQEHNLRLVAYIINKKFQTFVKDNPLMDSEDLMEIGVIGLIKAIDTFNMEKEIKFATYASIVICNEILMSLRRIKKEKGNQSLNKFIDIDSDDTSLTLMDTLDSGEDIMGNYERIETEIVIKEALALLSDVERQVVELYYGFKDERLNIKQIGDRLGYSQSYVSRINAEAKRKLGKFLEKKEMGITKKVPKEMQIFNNLSGDDRLLFYANTIVEKNITVEELSKLILISAGRIKSHIKNRLPDLDNELYEKVKVILDKQKEELDKKRLKNNVNKKQLKI